MSEFTTIRVKKPVRDAINGIVSPGQTLNEALEDIFIYERGSSTVDAIRANLDDKARVNVYLEGKLLWRDALKKSIDSNRHAQALQDAYDRAGK